MMYDDFLELGKKYNLIEDNMRPFLLYPDRDKVRGPIAEFHGTPNPIIMCHTQPLLMNELAHLRPFILMNSEYVLVDNIGEAEKIVSETVQKVKQFLKRMRLEAIKEL